MTQAARQLDVTPAAVSAAVQRIENAVGVRLFERTTRSLHPTREGLAVVEGCRDAIERWYRALDEARGDGVVLEGEVHVSAPADTTYQVLADVVANFSSRHSRVRVVLHAADAVYNVHRDALDVAIRYGPLPDSSLATRKLAEAPRVLVAAPSYVATHGIPTSLGELAEHRLLTLQLGNVAEHVWSLSEMEAGVVDVDLHSPLCGDGFLVRQWALSGKGIAFKSLLDVVDDLEAGRLTHVLPGFTGDAVVIRAVYPSRRFIPSRVRLLVADIASELAAMMARCDRWQITSVGPGDDEER